MKNLPAQKNDLQSLSLAIYNPQKETKAIDIRRMIIKCQDVINSLTDVENYIFNASVKAQVSEIDDNTLVAKLSQMFVYIAKDVGYNINNNSNEWAYTQTRLLDIIKKYYSQLSLAEIKLAFELATTGELDEYLPKDSQGNADRKHYQNFNADYLCKILNAYKKKENEVINKAYNSVPKPAYKLSDEQKIYYHNKQLNKNKNIFLKYKENKELIFGLNDENCIYKWLKEVNLADDIYETEQDRQEALSKCLHRAAKGLINKYTAYNMRMKGTKSNDIDDTAYEIARRKEIIRVFDKLISDNVDINIYLNYKK